MITRFDWFRLWFWFNTMMVTDAPLSDLIANIALIAITTRKFHSLVRTMSPIEGRLFTSGHTYCAAIAVVFIFWTNLCCKK